MLLNSDGNTDFLSVFNWVVLAILSNDRDGLFYYGVSKTTNARRVALSPVLPIVLV